MPYALRITVSLVCIVLTSALGLGGVATPAAASTALLCRGYDACAAAGMPHAGYKAARWTSWWNMYPGHNCTNYAAYRMVRSGLSTTRPWPTGPGTGNAETWGVYKAAITDATPRVGAVAWWKANVPGAGSSGHVAYVEAVLSPDKIVVSEDSWGGDFQWRRITRSGTGWPSGFIHFNDVRVQNTVLPSVSGTPRVGQVLAAAKGTWGPVAARERATYRYQWRASGVKIADATGSTFTVRPDQQGQRISVRVSMSSPGYLPASAVSAATAPVEAATLENTAPPQVSGNPVLHQELTASPGAWSAAPTALSYQWLADGVPVEGATTAILTPGFDLVGKALSVRVTAERDGYTDATAVSATTEPVAPGTFVRTAAPVVSGAPRLGQTLQVDPGDYSPTDADVSVQWLRAGVPVDAATGPTYQLTAADLGSRIAARVTLTRPGYTPQHSRSVRTRRVKAVPLMRLSTTPGTGRLSLTVRLSAEGVRPVTGTVRVAAQGRVLRDLTLRDGAASTTLRGLPRGRRTFRVRYLGSTTVTAAEVLRTVRIG